MDNHEKPEFDLDEILKEFSGEDLPEMPVDLDLAAPLEEAEEEPRDTIRLDQIRKAVKSATVTEDTVPFQPVEQAEEEPYVKTWEPAYEETPEEFAAQQPIIFRPKNRLRELRQKLVDGPERRYYALSEVGTAKLQASIFLHILLLMVALGGVVLYAMNLVGDSRMRLLIFTQLLSMLLSGLLGCYRMMEGIGSIFKGRFTLKSLLAFTFLACCIDGVRCLGSLQMPGCAVFCLQMLMAQLAEKQSREAEMAMMDTLRKATNLYSVYKVEDYHEGRPGYATGEGQVEDFMEHYAKPSAPEKAVHVFALLTLLAGAAVGVYAAMTYGPDQGIRFGTTVLLAGAPAGVFFSMVRPLAVLEKRLHKLGTVLCGWKGIRQEKKAAFFPLTHEDLFPAGSIKLNGVKYYGSASPDTVVAYTASLIAEDGGCLTDLFLHTMESRGGYKFHVENFRCYENGGIGGELGGESVLVGTLGFMRHMGVEMPQNLRLPHAVCTAIDGTLCGVFALAYNRTKGAAAAMQSLCDHGKLRPILVGNDFVLTESFLKSKFRAKARRVVFPERDVREALAVKELPREGNVIALSVREGLAQKGLAVTGARVLRSAWKAGAIVHIFAGALGVAMIAALAVTGSDWLISPQNLLLYNLLWLIPGWLITEWTRQL
jgi:cation transport ATPase